MIINDKIKPNILYIILNMYQQSLNLIALLTE